MNKSFLAIKCVSENNQSTWIRHPLLRTTYNVGETLIAKHKSLGFYLADHGNYHGGRLSVSSNYRKILVVRVNERDLSSETPWLNWDNDSTVHIPNSIEKILKCINTHHYVLSTQKLTVLSEHSDQQPLEEILKQARKKYKIPFVKHADFIRW